MSSMTSQPFVQAQVKENSKAPHHWPLWGEWIHRWPVNSPHKGPVTREIFPFDHVTMNSWLTSQSAVGLTPYLDIFDDGLERNITQTNVDIDHWLASQAQTSVKFEFNTNKKHSESANLHQCLDW